MLPFTVRFVNDVPVSDQIVRAVRKAVLTGRLQPGDAFPSVRALSQELRISPTTAHKSVSQLKDAGYLASRPGIGMVVTAPGLPSRDEAIQLLLPACAVLLQEAEELGLTPEDVAWAVRTAAGLDDEDG